jgi:putative redox protein
MKIAFRGDTQFDVVSGNHTVVTDQPVEDGGNDAGMSPVELFVGSLASCIGYFVGRYCARHQIPTEGFTIDVSWSMAEQPHRVGTIELRINLATTLTSEQRERLLKVAHGCTVHQSLAVPPAVEISLGQATGSKKVAGS